MTAWLYLPVVHIEKENKERGKQSTAKADEGRGFISEKEDSKKHGLLSLGCVTKILSKLNLFNHSDFFHRAGKGLPG